MSCFGGGLNQNQFGYRERDFAVDSKVQASRSDY